MAQLPASFVRQIQELLPAEEAAALLTSLNQSPQVSVRNNPRKRIATFDSAEPVPWAQEGHYLAQRPSFTFDPLLHAGCYYVQEASSMFVEQAYRQMDIIPERMLDLCAAPGGKSTLWRSLLPDGALLVANEPMRQRAQILAENLTKWGHPDVVVTQAFPDAFAPLEGFFDVIAADVPCSGEGMFRKDEEAIQEWSLENVDQCAARQWQIVNDIWPTLREGGYFVYSTCTYNRQENEDNVWRICRELGAELVAIPCDPDWGILGDTTGRDLPVYHFFPSCARGEGFFLALLRKTAPASVSKDKKKKKGGKEQPVTGGATLASWLSDGQDFKLFATDGDQIHAVRKSLYEAVCRVTATVPSLLAGVALAESKGKKLIPQHGLALSLLRAATAFPTVELDYATAIAYLRRETLVLAADEPRGYVVVTYQGHALGFANNLGSRANNLYPQEWRIRSVAPKAGVEAEGASEV